MSMPVKASLDFFNSFRVNHEWVTGIIFIINIIKVKLGL